jgi:hypothetical protein
MKDEWELADIQLKERGLKELVADLYFDEE